MSFTFFSLLNSVKILSLQERLVGFGLKEETFETSRETTSGYKKEEEDDAEGEEE
jgi:hypothetical protein